MSALVAIQAKPVFINCPFDDAYLPFFRAAIFTITRCGFTSRSALEAVDGAETRIQKIVRIIHECSMGIHDISRTELDKKSKLPRFNMPFELGLFLGAKFYGTDEQKEKACLVLDRERFRYQQFISDIAGQDISSHDDDVHTLVVQIRDFLNTHNGPKPLPSGKNVWKEYQTFQERLPEICEELKLTEETLQFGDYLFIVADYLSEDDPPEGVAFSNGL